MAFYVVKRQQYLTNFNALSSSKVINKISDRVSEEINDGQSHVSEHTSSQSEEPCIDGFAECPQGAIHHQECERDVCVRE